MEPGTSLREEAPAWSLAGDKKLLSSLEVMHQKIVEKSQDVNSKLECMISSLNIASVAVQNVNNRFMALSNSQFIESRVFDDDDVDINVHKVEEPVRNEAKLSTNIDPADITKSVLTLQRFFEQAIIFPDDSEDESSSDDEYKRRIILKPKDMYEHRPLPYIIGSDNWKNKWHAGLILEDSDDESTVSKKDTKEQFSESEEDTNNQETIPVNRKLSSTDEKTETLSKDKSPDTVSAEVLPQKTQSDLAAELARRLTSGNVPTNELQSDKTFIIPTDNQPKNPVKHMFTDKIQNNNAVPGVFADEPPPLPQSDDDGIFSDMSKPNKTCTTDSHFDDLFNSGGDIFDDFPSIRISDNNKLTAGNSTAHRSYDKKPAGAVSIFAPTKATDHTIGSGIIHRPDKQQSSSYEEIYSTPNKNSENEQKTQPKDSLNKRNQKENVFNKELPKIAESQKKFVVTDNIFDDIDDMFSTDFLTKPKSDDSAINKSIFDDEDDGVDELFADIQILTKDNNKRKTPIHNIFQDETDDLFSDINSTAIKSNTVTEENVFNNTNTNRQNNPIDCTTSVLNENNTNSTQIINDDKLFQSNKYVERKSEIISSYPHNIAGNTYIKETKINTSQDVFESIVNDRPHVLQKPKESTPNINPLFGNVGIMKQESIKNKAPNYDIFGDETDDFLTDVNSTLVKSDTGNKVSDKTKDKNKNFNITTPALNENCNYSERSVFAKNTIDVDDNDEKKLFANVNILNNNIIRKKVPSYNNIFGNETDDIFSDVNSTVIKSNTVSEENVFKNSNINRENKPIDITTSVSNENDTNSGHPINDDKQSNKNWESQSEIITNYPYNITGNTYIKETKINTSQDIFESILNDLPPVLQKPKESTSNINPQFGNVGIMKQESNKNKAPEYDIFGYETDDFLCGVNSTSMKSDTGSKVSVENADEIKKFNVISPVLNESSTNNSILNDDNPKNTKTAKSNIDSPNDDFNNVFNDLPPMLEKPQKINSKNINALFDDHFEDDLLFFKTNDISEEQVNVISKQTESITENIDVLKVNTKDEDIFSARGHWITSTPLGTQDNETDLDTQVNDIDITDGTQYRNYDNKPIGKLKSTINIDVNTLIPGGSPTKIKYNETFGGVSKSKSNLEYYTPQKQDVSTSSSFENDTPVLASLCNKISKERVKIQVKRHPSTRKARINAINKSDSALDKHQDDITIERTGDSNITTLGKVYTTKHSNDLLDNNETKHINVDAKKKLIIIDDDNMFNLSITNNKTETMSDPLEELTKTIKYDPDEDDIFTTYNKKPNELKTNILSDQIDTNQSFYGDNSTFNTSEKTPREKININSNTSTIRSGKQRNTKFLFDSSSDEELFGAKKNISKESAIIKSDKTKILQHKKSIFDDDDDEELFRHPAQNKEKTLQWTAHEKVPTASEVVLEDPLSALEHEQFF